MQTMKVQLDAAATNVEMKSMLVHHAHLRQGAALYMSEVLSDREDSFQDIMLIDSHDENEDCKENEPNGREENRSAWIESMTRLPSDIVRSVHSLVLQILRFVS